MAEELIQGHFKKLNNKYTGLELSKNKKGEFVIVGTIAFSAGSDEHRLEDEYDIKIEILPGYPDTAPVAKEIGNRIPADFHTHTGSKILCLAAPFEIKRKFRQSNNLIGFVESLVIPFLYSYSFFEKYKRMPFDELPHGTKGIIEYYKELFNVDSTETILAFFKILADNSYKDHNICPCRSGRHLKKCHGNLLKEIMEIHGHQAIKYEYNTMTASLMKEDRYKFVKQAFPKLFLKNSKP